MTTKRVLFVLVALSLACSRPGGPDRAYPDPSTNVDVVDAAAPGPVAACPPAQSSQTLPPWSKAMTHAAADTAPDSYFTSDLFALFKSVCGGCHVAGSYGNFTVTALDFPQKITQQILTANIVTDDPAHFMPPAGTPTGRAYSQRDPSDPVVQLATLLKLWIAQGSPASSFTLPTSSKASADPTTPGYRMSTTLAAELTNIGSCVPNRSIVAQAVDTMDTLDQRFASATALPKTLAETDLVSFDSQALAQQGVLSFAPNYPLWSDDAGKMRHVRVPRGQSIAFDKTTQRFQIPLNTRFYKTFLKKIIDVDGQERYRKIETRLIVARPDGTAADGTITQTALYGTYLWNDDETEAVLHQTPLDDGKGFKDRVLPAYDADEPRVKAILATNPPNPEYALQIQNPGVQRHYAVPGSERCTQCHMGSSNQDFILGFTPLQLARRATGEGGGYEPSTGDELTQLARFISYGLITGMASPDDVTRLEDSQGDRHPRTDQELAAQAYMLGNCAHCHNPRGFPSTKDPELKAVLDFFPGPGANEGVFEFPLDRVSPLRTRGRRQDVPIPYITPSLRDLPDIDPSYRPKYQICEEGRAADGWCTKKGQAIDFIDAPWRSLIYRNVDTPFDYVDDFTIFPHMPMSTSGYDCRAPRIMADWMVSIPAVRTSTLSEDLVGATGTDGSPQPYVEVKPDDPRYAAAQKDAAKRLATYHAGHRYGFCPNTTDIVDPDVLRGKLQTPADVPVYDNGTTPPTLVMLPEGVPNHPHFVETDLTDPPLAWEPRNATWEKALVDHDGSNPSLSGDALASLKDVVAKLANVSLTDDVRTTLTTERPFGLWQQKAACSFAGVPTAGSFTGDARPRWLDVRGGVPVTTDPAAPVYVESAGAAIFNNICVNCHGPNADAKGLLADEISLMTGGAARVANFRIGLFGPEGMAGANRARVFARPGGTPDDYGARYLAWMALGGTQKTLPADLLKVVANTRVFGQSRNNLVAHGSANMLQLAQQLCTGVLPSNQEFSRLGDLDSFFRYGAIDWTKQTSLIGDNGDAELWLRVCGLNNRPVVRVLVPAHGTWDPEMTAAAKDLWISFDQSLFWGDGVDDATKAPVFPTDAPVMDHRGHVVKGLTADNLFPLCVQAPADATERKNADAFLQKNRVGGATGEVVPYCPPALFATVADQTDDKGKPLPRWRLAYQRNSDGNIVFTDAESWANRGAINAGLAVFLYVDQLARGQVTPKPPYNQCERLTAPKGS